MAEPEKKPVDLEHLDRYTGGDRAINKEILSLFEGSCGDIVARLEKLVGPESTTPETRGSQAKAWHEATHTLKGAARGIGAFALADAVERAEKNGLSSPLASIEALATIKAQAQLVHEFIEAFVKGEPV